MKTTPQPHGLTIVEVVMAMAIISVALLALMSSVISAMTLVEVNRQESLAMNAARDKIAEMQSKAFVTVLNTYRGHQFNVTGLQAGGGQAGQVLFPQTSGHLSETITDITLGMPRDLNLDGDITDTNCDGDYLLLPVKIRMSWTTIQGIRSLEFNTILTAYK